MTGEERKPAGKFIKFRIACVDFLKAAGRKILSGFKVIVKNKKALIGLIIVSIFVFTALFGSLIFPYDTATNWSGRYQGASWAHPLGTDELGRDVFRQLIYGSKSVLAIAFLTAVFTTVIGVSLGLISGYGGKYVDKVIQAITNIFLTVPSFPILLLLSQLLTIETPVSFALVMSAWNWAGLCRAVRAQCISLKERDFIVICKVMHINKTRIIFGELLPNIYSYILINFIMIMRNAITGSVGIMMLGLAAFEPANWGAMLNRALLNGLVNPDVMKFMLKPLFTIIIFQIGAILLTNGLDEIFNPRLRQR